MLETLLMYDRSITAVIRNSIPHTDFFNRFFTFFSFSGSSIIIWFFIFALLFVFEQRKNKKFLYIFVFTLGATYIFVDFIMKNLFQRQRPLPDPTAYWKFACPIDFGFPSTHATTAFAAAVILAYFDKKRSVWYFILAVLVSLSRIYLGCHYLIDVVAGALVGALISWSVLRFFFRK